MIVHPAYDVVTKTWFVETGEEATSLRELKKQLKPYTKIADYYPNGYRKKIIYREKLRTTQKPPIQTPRAAQDAQGVKTAKNDATKTTITRPTIKRCYPDTVPKRRCIYNHNTILNMWYSGLDAPTIADALSIKRWTSVVNIVWQARRKGDPRAVERNRRLAKRVQANG